MAFHNPYHFIPIKSGDRTRDLTREAFEKADFSTHPHVTHDRFVENTHAGKLICRMTTEDPIFVGDKVVEEVTEEEAKKVSHFELDGKPAIPSTSLRGLISSWAEAASNSTLRVLEEKPYSFRRAMDDPKNMSAIGMIVLKENDEGEKEYWLRPLTLPSIQINDVENISLPIEYRGLYQTPNLKVYLNNPAGVTFRSDTRKFYYLNLHQREWNEANSFSGDPNLYIKNGRFLLAQTVTDNRPTPVSEEKAGFTRGILRVMDDGSRDLPNTRHHEVFIPYPEEAETWKVFKITPDAVERFYDLADQRTDEEEGREELPFHPIGTDRNESGKDNKFRLKEGDLVYFRPSGGFNQQIIEISLSAIWRGRVETGSEPNIKRATAHTFFSSVDKELIPFNKDRTVITIAERLFGFVEQESEKDKTTLALAGRLRCSHALFHGIQTNSDPLTFENDPDEFYEDEVTLKILAGPKPPSPALYFKPNNNIKGGYISKESLNIRRHEPHGRKMYIHKNRQGRRTTPEAYGSVNPSDNVKQKVRITPLKPQTAFYFHIDFDNLSQRELGLLLFVLNPYKIENEQIQTIEGFRHKIGMGKPLGLGKVRIEPVGLFLINRRERYSAGGFNKPRYEKVWLGENEPHQWGDRYRAETNAGSPEQINLEDIKRQFIEGMDADILRAIELIGDPQFLRAPVGQSGEQEGFKWFVENDTGDGRSQYLEPLHKDTLTLPTLNEN